MKKASVTAKMLGFSLCLGFALTSVAALDVSQKPGLGIHAGADMQATSLEQALATVKAGDIVVLGEQHGTSVQADQQVKVMKQLKDMGLSVSVGLEFFEYLDQSSVYQWRRGLLSEENFLKAIRWGGFPFSAYREQALFPHSAWDVRAINAPRSLTGKIAKTGMESLTTEEKGLLPPDFTIGNANYFERFKDNIGHLPDPSAADRYFAAQSVWDDTMAWKIHQYMDVVPNTVMVIVVGEFHVQYGGGLPDRLRARAPRKVHTFSLLNLHDMSQDEINEAVQPHSKYGVRADWLWLSDFE